LISTPNRIPELDGIRGLAILSVLLWHYIGGALDLDQPWAIPTLKALNLAWTGVDLFFVLSGFLIGGIMLDRRSASNFLGVFYLRRSLRIIPIYYLVVLSYVLARHSGLAQRPPAVAPMLDSTISTWSYVTFTQNFLSAHTGLGGPPWLQVTWSLAVEEQFYICLPFLIFLVPNARLGWVLGGLILAVPVLRMFLYDFPPKPGFADYVLMPARADSLLLGVLAAWLVRRDAARSWMEQHVRWLYVALAVLFLGVAFLHQWRVSYISFGMMAIGYTWIAAFYGCLMLVAIYEKRGLVTFVARNPALRYLGGISYGVYLFHQIIHGLAHGILLHQSPTLKTATDGLVTVLAIVLTLALASASWYFFEKPLVEYGHSFKYAYHPVPAPADPTRPLNSSGP
jgi:peptidoglycan/LPS O-acetylase OafA/YrhL